MSILDDEILQSFVEESREHLADIENDLLAVEEGGADVDEDLINKVFRAAHSIKGGAGFMGLDKIKDLSHKVENVLGMIRGGEIVPDSESVNILLLAFDKLREMINDVDQSNDADISEFVVSLTGITSAYLPEEKKSEVTQLVDICADDGRAIFTVSQFDISQAKNEYKTLCLVEYDLIHDVHDKGIAPLQLMNRLADEGIILDCKVELCSVGTLEDDELTNNLPFFIFFASNTAASKLPKTFGVKKKKITVLSDTMIVESAEPDGSDILPPPEHITAEMKHLDSQPQQETTQPTEIENADIAAESQPAVPENKTETEVKMPDTKEKKNKTAAVAETNLRVNVKLLDSLMNLAGELVLSRNELVQATTSGDPAHMTAASQRINLVTSELQEAIMLTRMQPVGNIFNKFPRVVRDLASSLDKKMELSIIGKEVELDKTIIEGLADPLTHLVRNSADHGIEDPQTRKKQGKNEIGQICLKAYHDAGQVNIEIVDDGKGINPQKLTASALSKGLITEEQANTMSDKEKVALIFMPGFSMAEKLTDVSGRGVGMDVVKTNLDKLGGTVDITSAIGQGTTIRIKLPLTLAIIPSLMISTNNQQYAIPMANVVELLRISASQIKDRIEKVGNADVVRVRQELLPILNLNELIAEYQAEPEQDDNNSPASDGAMNIVVVSTGGFKYGLVVDQLHDSEEIVVKSLDKSLKNCQGYAGATILGNGQVALILDITGLAKMADVSIEDTSDKVAVKEEDAAQSKSNDNQALLLFGSSEDEKFAVAVGEVQRIEKIKASDVENTGGKKVIQYRGAILPVYTIDEVANVKPLAESKNLLVIVFKAGQREFGLLAMAPVDTVAATTALDTETLKQPGIKGSVIVDGQTTLVVDIYQMIETLNPDWTEKTEAVEEVKEVEEEIAEAVASDCGTILYAEDSSFFRNTVKKMLEGQGYNVIEAEDGQIAWNLFEENAEKVSLVVTDVEMPNLDGIGLTKKIRGDSKYDEVPIVALTTLAGEEDIEIGKAAGVTEYQVKLDEENLLNCVNNFMNKS